MSKAAFTLPADCRELTTAEFAALDGATEQERAETLLAFQDAEGRNWIYVGDCCLHVPTATERAAIGEAFLHNACWPNREEIRAGAERRAAERAKNKSVTEQEPIAA